MYLVPPTRDRWCSHFLGRHDLGVLEGIGYIPRQGLTAALSPFLRYGWAQEYQAAGPLHIVKERPCNGKPNNILRRINFRLYVHSHIAYVLITLPLPLCRLPSKSMWPIGVCMGRVGSGWGDFLTQSTMVGQKKIQPNPTHHINPTQPNPTHMGQVGSGWTHGFEKKKYYYY